MMTSEFIVVKAGLNVARSVFALGQKNATIGFKLTKFLQEKHTSLCGTISDVTQVNVHLQKKKENNKKSNKERNMKQIDE